MKAWYIIVALLAILVLFGVAYEFKSSQFPCHLERNGADCIETNVYWSVFWGVTWILASFWFAYLCALGTPKAAGGPDDRLLFSSFLLSGVVGGTAGWLLGVYFFPIDSSEAQAFNRVSTVVGSMIGGYLLKELTQVVQFITNTDSGKKTPLILSPAYRECALFFVVSLLVSGGIQVALRNLGEIRVSWDGGAPPLDEKKARYVIAPGAKFQLAGAATGATNIAVRWRLEATDDNKLRDAISKKLITIAVDGALAVQDEAAWKKEGIEPEFDFDIVASAAERPELAKSLPLHIKKSATTAAPASAAPATTPPAVPPAKPPATPPAS